MNKFTREDINRIVENEVGKQYIIAAVSLGGLPILREIATRVEFEAVGGPVYVSDDKKLMFAMELVARKRLL